MRHLLQKATLIAALLLCHGSLTAQNSPWEATNGPLGGVVKTMAVDSAGTLFISTQKGVFYSDDNGLNWTLAGEQNVATYATGMAINDAGHIFLSTSNLGVQRSRDNGASWQAVNSGLDGRDVRSLFIRDNGEIIIAVYGKGVFRSTDSGDTWTADNSGLTNLGMTAVLTAPNGDSYAGTYTSGIFRRSAGDTLWREINSGLNTLRCNTLENGVEGDIYLGTNNGVYLLSAGDSAWAEIKGTGTSPGYVYDVYVKKNSDLLFAVTLNGPLAYDAYTDAWLLIGNGIDNLRMRGMAENNDGELLTHGDGGVYHSADGGRSWHKRVEGLRISRISGILLLDDGSVLAATENNGVKRSPDNGDAWTSSNTGMTGLSIKSLIADSGGVIYAGVSGQTGVYVSHDDGNSWSVSKQGFTGSNALALTARDDKVYAHASGRVYHTDNGGESWQQLPEGGLTNTNVRSMAVNAGGILFAGTWNGGVFRIAPGDTAWTEVNNGLSKLLVYKLLVSDRDELFAATSGGGIFKSTDNGDNWTEMNGGLPSLYPKTLAQSPSGTLFAGFYGKVAYSVNNGASWQEMSAGLSGADVSAMLIDDNDLFYAGTTGSGVYRTTLSPTGLAGEDNAPRSFTLEQNYPNPFNPSTTISFRVNRASEADIRIYDMLGREVRLLFKAGVAAGRHSVTWNGRDNAGNAVASGFYYYRLRDGNTESIRRMLLLK